MFEVYYFSVYTYSFYEDWYNDHDDNDSGLAGVDCGNACGTDKGVYAAGDRAVSLPAHHARVTVSGELK